MHITYRNSTTESPPQATCGKHFGEDRPCGFRDMRDEVFPFPLGLGSGNSPSAEKLLMYVCQMTPLGHCNEYFAVFLSLKFRPGAVVTVVDYNNANFRNEVNRPYQPLYIRVYSTPLDRDAEAMNSILTSQKRTEKLDKRATFC